MNSTIRSVFRLCVGFLSLATVFCAEPVPTRADTSSESPELELAQEIFETTGIRGGLVVHLGCGDPPPRGLTAALAQRNNGLVHGLESDADQVRRARDYIRSLGIYGRVSIERFDGDRLPYVDNLVNLIVASGECQVAKEEVLRVLTPRGVAIVREKGNEAWLSSISHPVSRIGDGFVMFAKPVPPDIDEWTHWLHGADGNAVADDRIVGPPRHVQWVAPPQWQRHHEASPSVSAMVSSAGRLFAIINEAPAGIDGLPDRWAVVARDAFNGKHLWKRPIAEWGWSQWSDHSYGHGRWNHPTHIHRRMVAVGDRVYVTLGFNAPLTALDAATGRTVMTYPETQFTDEILYDDGTLVLSVNTAATGPGRVKSSPPVKKEVVALNAQTGKVLWRTDGFVGIASKADAIERVTHLSMVLGDGRVFCVEEDAVVALDMKTGKRLWSAERAPRQRPVTYGSYYFTNLCSIVYHDGIVLFMEPDPTVTRQPWNDPAKSTLLAISAETGEVVWTRNCGLWGHYNQGDIFIIDNLVWVHDGESFSMLGLAPQTGEVKRTLATKEALDQGHHHRCYRNKATPRYIITGRRGVEFIDVESEENQRHHWTRGTCRYGVLPCNGLLYMPPHPCICYITAKLNGFWALAPKRQPSEVRNQTSATLEKGPAYADIQHPVSSNQNPASSNQHPDSWPTYRHDAARSGCAGTAISGDLMPAWTSSVGGRLTSPVVAEGRVLVASPDTHTVWSVDADDGKRLWSFTGNGRIDTPPTVHRGLTLFGSADGWVYCLRASDGELVWRLRAAPDDSRIVDDDRLASPWPVHGSVLVQDDVVYFAAGRSSFLDGGIYVYAVEAETGKVLRQRIDSLDAETDDMVEARLPYDMPPDALGALPDILVGDGANVYMRHLRFNTTDLTYASASETKAAKRGVYPATGGHLTSVAGLLDDNWFNQTYWTVDGKAHSKLLVFDDRAAYGVKTFSGSARHSRAIFRPGAKGYTLFSSERPKHQTRWSVQIPVRIRAMALAGTTLFAAGTPDVIDPDDPWSAIEGKKGGTLWAISTADGKRLAEYPLKSAPVYDGMAAANGRLYISTKDGSIACYTAKSTTN